MFASYLCKFKKITLLLPWLGDNKHKRFDDRQSSAALKSLHSGDQIFQGPLVRLIYDMVETCEPSFELYVPCGFCHFVNDIFCLKPVPPCFNLAPDQQTAARTDSILFCFGSQLSTQGYNNLAVVSWVGIKLCSWASPRESLHSKSVWFVLHKINQDKQECKSLVGRRCWGSHGEVTVPSLNGGHCPRPHSQSNPPSTLC